MMPTDVPSPAIVDRAANWLARRDAGFTPEESTAFETWLAADPRHSRAVAELEAAWSLLRRPRDAGHAARVLNDLAQRAHLRRLRVVKRFTWAASGLAAAAALVLAFWLPSRLVSPAAKPATASTISSLPQRLTLADGSLVELNAEAEVEVTFSPTRRSVRLLRGEAHFAVVKDAARPFVVAAGPIETRAVGTAFSVRYATQDVRVLVTEGRVAVAHRAASAAEAASADSGAVLIDAGTRLTIPLSGNLSPTQPEPLTLAESESALLWRTQRVEFSATALAEAVALFNRQNHTQLALADASLGDLRLSGIFWANDPAGFARLVSASFGLRVETRDETAITLRR